MTLATVTNSFSIWKKHNQLKEVAAWLRYETRWGFRESSQGRRLRDLKKHTVSKACSCGKTSSERRGKKFTAFYVQPVIQQTTLNVIQKTTSMYETRIYFANRCNLVDVRWVLCPIFGGSVLHHLRNRTTTRVLRLFFLLLVFPSRIRTYRLVLLSIRLFNLVY